LRTFVPSIIKNYLFMQLPDNPYLLLTPGPLSTSKTVKAAMLRDWCTWDDDYNKGVVQHIRHKLVNLATKSVADYTSVLMQGSGTFSVESVIGSVIPETGKLLVISNGAYGDRICQIANRLKINNICYPVPETDLPDLEEVRNILLKAPEITHVAMVHCETTAGILNPVAEITRLVKTFSKIVIVDAMSSFGGIPFDVSDWEIDFLISSANKCIQGVPGFGFIIARKTELEKCKGIARSLSLDLFDQWEVMEKGNGKWRFTSPTHVVRAFAQALDELDKEGGIERRYERYQENHKILVTGMRKLGFETVLTDEIQSPVITSFVMPQGFSFNKFYYDLKEKGFVIYPGKVAKQESFRIGNIGEVYPADIQRLLEAVKSASK
jgi:2-aminoethylphosphonate-pyruvate transaminase